MQSSIQNLIFKLFLNTFKSSSFWSLASTGLRLGGFFLVLPIMLRKLSSEELGIWYVFVAASGLVVLLDMGFSSTTTRAIGYAWAGAKKLEPLGVSTEKTLNQPNKELALELVSTSLRFYQILAVIVLALFTCLGTPYMWNISSGTKSQPTTLLAWGIFTLGIALSTLGSIWPALLTGINQVRISQQIQFFSIFCSYTLNVTLLLAGFGLIAPVIGKLIEGLLLRGLGRHIFLSLASFPKKPLPRWNSKIFYCLWPMAWRTGLVSIGAFLIMNVNTFLVASLVDLETTGSYGLSMQIMNTLIGVSGIWLTVVIPKFNQLRVHEQLDQLVMLFVSRHRLSLLTYSLGAAVLYLFGPPLLSHIGANTPLLSKPLFGILLFIGLLEMNHIAYAHLVLSQNHNPFVLPAICSGIAIILLSYIFAPLHGIWAIVLAQGVVQAFFNNWFPILVAARSVRKSPFSLIRLVLGIKRFLI